MLAAGTVSFVIALPNPWPVPRKRVLYAADLEGTRVEVVAVESGGLALLLDSILRFVSQPILIPGGSQIDVIARWSPSKRDLMIGGHVLQSDNGPDTLPVIFAPVAPPVQSARSVLYPALDPSQCADSTDEFFANTVRDLDRRAADRSAYEIVRAAGILRQLLLDESNLVDRVNRAHQIKIRFTILDPEPFPGKVKHHWRNPDPTYCHGARTVEMSRQQFLAAPSLLVDGISASIRDVIKTCANAKGGVHFGPPEGPGQAAIVEWDAVVRILGEQPSINALAGICTVVLQGLRPLVEALKQKPVSGRPGGSHRA